MIVPFIDLKKQYKDIKKEIDSAISGVLQLGNFSGGADVATFEHSFSQYVGTKFCISLNSGTDALILGLRALNLNPGDEVIIPTNTFIATSIGATENGLKPIFVDIDESDNGINLIDLKKKITSKTKAIILVHLYGQAEKIDDIKKIIKQTGKKIYIIEDVAQANGAEYKKRKLGTFGIFSIFSFYPTKTLGAFGDGGAICTQDASLAKKIRLLKNYGESQRYRYSSIGVNSRLDTIQAAILNAKLPHLDQWNKRRYEFALYYDKKLKNLSEYIQTPPRLKGRNSVHHLYVIRTQKRDGLQAYLQEKGVTTHIHYPCPLHLQKIYSHYDYKKGNFPIAEKVACEILSLPLFPEITPKQIDYVANSICDFFQKKSRVK